MDYETLQGMPESMIICVLFVNRKLVTSVIFLCFKQILYPAFATKYIFPCPTQQEFQVLFTGSIVVVFRTIWEHREHNYSEIFN